MNFGTTAHRTRFERIGLVLAYGGESRHDQRASDRVRSGFRTCMGYPAVGAIDATATRS